MSIYGQGTYGEGTHGGPVVIPDEPPVYSPYDPPRPHPYRYLVEDIMSGIVVCRDLPLNDAVYDLDTPNRPGTLTATLPVAHHLATLEILYPAARAVYVERNGRIDWGGILWSANVPMGSEQISVECEGWLGWLDHRDIWRDRQFTGVDQFEIFATLVGDAQDDTYLGAGADVDLDVVWDALSGVRRDRIEEYRDFRAKNLGEAVRQLAATVDGFDFAMEYRVENDRIVKTIRLSYPRKGRDTGFLFHYEAPSTSKPLGGGNIMRRAVPFDASRTAWHTRGWGDGADESRLRSTVIEERFRGVFPMLDSAPQFSGVTVQATLDDHTAAANARSAQVTRYPAIDVNPDVDPCWGSYAAGDVVHVRIDDGFASVDDYYRIIGGRMNTTDDVPTLTLDAA